MFGNKCLNWDIDENSKFKHNINFKSESATEEADPEIIRKRVSDLEYSGKNNCINIDSNA